MDELVVNLRPLFFIHGIMPQFMMIFTKITSRPFISFLISKQGSRRKVMQFRTYVLTSRNSTSNTLNCAITKQRKCIPVIIFYVQKYSFWIGTFPAIRTFINYCLFPISHNISMWNTFNIASWTNHNKLHKKSPLEMWDKHKSNRLIHFIISCLLIPSSMNGIISRWRYLYVFRSVGLGWTEYLRR